MSHYYLELHIKRHSDFDLLRILRAQQQGFFKPITAYLSSAFFAGGRCYGVLFGHARKDQFGRFDDGHLIYTSLIVSVAREGRFWVITTQNSRYVIATFLRDRGRQSFQDLRQIPGIEIQVPYLLPS